MPLAGLAKKTTLRKSQKRYWVVNAERYLYWCSRYHTLDMADHSQNPLFQDFLLSWLVACRMDSFFYFLCLTSSCGTGEMAARIQEELYRRLPLASCSPVGVRYFDS